MACAGIITSGLAERHPRLRLAFSHGAGGFPMMLPRAMYFWGKTWNEEPSSDGVGLSPAELTRRFFYDGLVFDRRALRFLIDLVGHRQVLVGSDFPAMPREDPCARTLRSLDLPADVLEDITWHNTFRFLGIEAPELVGAVSIDYDRRDTVKTRAAVVRGPGQAWEVTELELDEPKEHEVLVRVMACGLCHSDEHVREGGPYRYPMVGGHEGAGVVEKVGPSVTRVREGDHICTSWIPVCGHCRYCSTGHQNMCNDGLNAGTGMFLDGTFRFHENGEDVGGMCVLGTFSQWMVIPENSCVPIDEDLPFEVAALVACGVTTGWGSSVYAAGTRAGETVVIFGTGGVGMNAVQGAAYAGAKNVIAVDPNPFKQEMAGKFGATFTTGDPEEAKQKVWELTHGEMADHAVITVGVMHAEVLRNAVDMIGKGGSVVVTAVGGEGDTIAIHGSPVTGFHKNIQGSLFGGANPLYDMPRLLGLYKNGDLKLDELITNRYTLDNINQGYEDMLAGRNIRGVLIHDH